MGFATAKCHTYDVQTAYLRYVNIGVIMVDYHVQRVEQKKENYRRVVLFAYRRY